MSTELIMRISRRLRLRRICKRLGIKPYPWQKSFALGKTDRLDAPPGVRTGKTMAVMLRLLMMREADYFEANIVLHCDPDFSDGYTRRYNWYSQEYRRLAKLCGVKPILNFERFVVSGDVMAENGNSGGQKQELWTCVRQSAGPLVKECRALRPRLSANDSPFERAEKNRILNPPRDSSVCRSRVDRLELRLALFGHEGSFYTLTFDEERLPASFREVESAWKSFLRRQKIWLGRSFDYVYCIEGKHGDHRYHIHEVVRDHDFGPAEMQHLWGLGWVDDEPLLRGPGDSFRRTARYMTKEATDGVVIPINKRVCRWSLSLNRQLPEAERFEAKTGNIRAPKDALSRGEYRTDNRFGAYRYAWYIKREKR